MEAKSERRLEKMAGGGTRVSSPGTPRDMIQNIKEITAGNYSEDEILAMLRECDMDPDETVQRLFLQDPFHEVKRKRDKRKESLSNKESTESQWRSSSQGRGNRGDRVNFSGRHASHDAGGAKNSFKKENGSKQVSERALIDTSTSTSQETKSKEPTSVSSSLSVLANGSAGLPSRSSDVQQASELTSSLGQHKANASSVTANKHDSMQSSIETSKSHGVAFYSGDMHAQLKSVDSLPDHLLPSEARYSSSGPKSGSIQSPQEQNIAENKFTGRSRGAGKTHLTDSHFSRPASAHSNSTGSRPSSNYSNRSQQTIGSQRAGCVMEWKPKPVNPNPSQGSGASSAFQVPAISAEANEKSLSVQDVLPSVDETSRLQKKLEDLHIRQHQHVIIPNHILVPEAERTKLSFGSFDAGFPLTSSMLDGPENGKSATPLSQTSQDVEQSLEEKALSNKNASAMEKEGDMRDNSGSPSQVPDDLTGERAISMSAAPEYDDSKQESALESDSNQNSSNNAPDYGMGFAPQVLGSQLPHFENTDSQACDVLRVPSFVVQQPFDPASYYAQFYRPNTDTDGRVSPLVSPGVATKYNGSATVLPPHSSQSLQEGGNTLVLSTASPTPLVTQAAGLMQSSIAVTQQPLPVFRPPPGMHMPHYPPNYIPYGHYFSPFYVPPSAMHQFLSNGAFGQQPQAGGVYPAPPSGAATGGKYSLPQYKTGTNTGSLNHVSMPSGYGLYGSFPGGYLASSAASAGNSTSNEDLNTLQLKENSGYNTGQQSEALPIWITGPGRDVSSLPASSFYNLQHHNLQHQGPHVTYAPTQAAHITFPNIYHPAQAITAATVHPLLQQPQPVAGPDMVAPTASVFQQPQQPQMNWPSNY